MPSIGILNIIMIVWLILLCVFIQFLVYRKGVQLVRSHHSYTFIQDALIKRYAPEAVLVLFLISVGIWMLLFVNPSWYKAIPFKFIFFTVKKYIVVPKDRPELKPIYNYMYILITTIISAFILMIINSAITSSVAKKFSKAKVFTGII